MSHATCLQPGCTGKGVILHSKKQDMLDKIISFSIRNKLLVAIMTVALVAWGVWSALRLPIDAVPDITDNQVQIITSSPTLATQEVEQLITAPIEQAIATLPGLQHTRSISRFGLSVVTAVFDEDVDVYFARQIVSERLKEAEEKIPQGLGTPEMAPVSTGLGEVYQYIIHPKPGSERKYSSKDLREMQDWIVARQLYGTPGVAEVNSFGGELKQYEVAVDPNRLRAMGVSITDIFDALQRNNENTGGAYIDKGPNAYFIRGIGRVQSLDDIRRIRVRSEQGTPVTINDVADVRIGHAVRYGALTYNGEVDAVGGIVMMLKGQNSNEVVKRVKAKLPTIQRSLPDDVTIEPYLDRSDLVGRAINTVETNLVEGALIVIFVLTLFLGNIRGGLIVASAIPLSLLFALGMMNLFGVSANLMSLGAIDFGIIVDGSVIVVEATMCHLAATAAGTRLTRKQMDQEVLRSASSMLRGAVFGEIIILMVYIPILTLVGVEGKMFRPMAQTVSFAIIGALVLSMTYIPMMSAAFLPRAHKPGRTLADRLMDRLARFHQPLLARAIRFRLWVVGAAVALLAMALFTFARMGGEFIPQLQEGDYAFHCILPQGASLKQSMETSMQAERVIRSFDEVRMVVGKTGSAEVPTDPMPPEATDLMIILKPRDQWKSGRTYDELANDIEKRLEDIPGVFFEKNQPIQMRFNELMTGVRQDVAVKIFGENPDTLAEYAKRVARAIRSVDGVTEPQVEQTVGLPQINVTYDHARMANYGIDISDANDVLSMAFAGKSAGVVFENERRFDLVARLDSTHRGSIDDVAGMVLPTPVGLVPLSQVADVAYRMGPAQVSRENGSRRIVVGFNVSGRDVSRVVRDIQARLNQQVKLPSGYYFTYGGQFENMRAANERLAVAVPLALVIIFVLLYIAFRSAKQATIIFTAIPMAAIGGVAALALCGMPFSISAGVGFIALFGVAVLNGVVLIGTFNQMRAEGISNPLRQIMEGTKTRLRPVLMTATVASLGFLPMALSQGAGAEVQRPLATVVIGGLVSSTLLTLFVLPLLYLAVYAKRRAWVVRTPGRTALVVMALVATAVPVMAQNSTRAYTIGELTEMAIKNNGTARAARLRAEAARLAEATAADMPKLDIGAQYGQYSSVNKDYSVSATQSIPFPTVFAARRKLYQAQTQAKRTQERLETVELRRGTRTAFCQALYLRQRKIQLERLDSLYADFERVARLRFGAGDTKRTDIDAACAKRGEIALRAKENDDDYAAAMETLRAIAGIEGRFDIAQQGRYRPMTTADLDTDTASAPSHPYVEISRNEAEVAKLGIDMEKANAMPEFTVGYTNQSLAGMQTINGVEQYVGTSQRYHFVSLGLAIPLPTGASKARRRALEREKEAEETEARQRQRQLDADLANAKRRYATALAKYAYYTNEAMPTAERMLKAAKAGYQAGETGYVEYLYAIQAVTDTRIELLTSVKEVDAALIDTLALMGK